MAWSQSGNIRGASGIPGASGASGVQGASGIPGASGPVGATGASGGTGGTGGPGTTTWADITDKPGAILNYKGTWNALTNSPALTDSTGSGGDVYRVSVAGSRNLGSGTISWEIGDYAIYSPVTSSWEKADTTDAVSSVAGRTGAVTLTSADLGASGTPSASTFLRGDNTWATGPIGATGASGGTGATGGTGAAGVNYSRVIQTITAPTTLGASGSTDYVTFLNIGSTDSNFNSVGLLVHADGSNNSTTITDSSLNNFSLTASGGAKISTAQSKFGGSSLLIGTGATDWVAIPDNDALEFGSGNLTIEAWIQTTTSSQYATIISRTQTASGWWTLMINHSSSTSGNIALYVSDFNIGAPLLETSGVSVRDGSWHHVAVIRNGSSWTTYVDGTSRATATWAGTMSNGTTGIKIGNDSEFTRPFNGYIDDVRITKGVARYTSGFTAPTTAFPDGTIGTPTLPTATSNTGRYSFRNLHSAAITIGASGSQAINGATGGLSLAAGASTELISNGTGWYSF